MKKDRGPMTGPSVDPLQSAKEAHLRYVNDRRPGIRRQRRGGGFVYIDPDGEPIHDQVELARIKCLAVPPAWSQVWICPSEIGHLQASGRDAKGRKQYLYHPRWREVRDETKFGRMIAFGRALPGIRRHVRKDLSLSGMPREKVLATIVRLLETTLIRIGNRKYVKQNNSFGLTTMRNRHAEISGTKIRFEFRGKSGKNHVLGLRDPQLAKIVKRCLGLPGGELFEYVDERGGVQTVDSAEVNEYLRQACGSDFTAKEFRTWAGSVLAMSALHACDKCRTTRQAKKNLTMVIEAIACALGNTPTICRKRYIHPEIINSYLHGTLLEDLGKPTKNPVQLLSRLKPEEAITLAFLENRAARPELTPESTVIVPGKRSARGARVDNQFGDRRPCFVRRSGTRRSRHRSNFSRHACVTKQNAC